MFVTLRSDEAKKDPTRAHAICDVLPALRKTILAMERREMLDLHYAVKVNYIPFFCIL